jgi:hypothetical protein
MSRRPGTAPRELFKLERAGELLKPHKDRWKLRAGILTAYVIGGVAAMEAGAYVSAGYIGLLLLLRQKL